MNSKLSFAYYKMDFNDLNDEQVMQLAIGLGIASNDIAEIRAQLPAALNLSDTEPPGTEEQPSELPQTSTTSLAIESTPQPSGPVRITTAIKTVGQPSNDEPLVSKPIASEDIIPLPRPSEIDANLGVDVLPERIEAELSDTTIYDQVGDNQLYKDMIEKLVKPPPLTTRTLPIEQVDPSIPGAVTSDVSGELLKTFFEYSGLGFNNTNGYNNFVLRRIPRILASRPVKIVDGYDNVNNRGIVSRDSLY